MYEYAPKPKKIKEKLIASLAILLAAAAYGCSGLSLPLPWVYQLLAVLCLGLAILVGGRYLLRDYVYRVVPNHGGPAPDLVVTELYARRRSVVCRIGLNEITEVQRITRENRRELAKIQRGTVCHRLVAERAPVNELLLTVEDGNSRYFVRICADEGLFQLLSNFKKQEMSEL